MVNGMSHIIIQKSEPNSCQNYRVISLVHTVCTIHAKILNNRLKNVTQDILSEVHYGFRKGR